MVAAEKLLLIAGAVWLIAGANIAIIGVGAAQHGPLAWWLLAGGLAVFLLFHLIIFRNLVKKHSARIRGYHGAPTAVWRFFDKKGYLIMAIMMGGGIALRVSGALPEWFIAFFYTGLGLALAAAGLSFGAAYVRTCRQAA